VVLIGISCRSSLPQRLTAIAGEVAIGAVRWAGDQAIGQRPVKETRRLAGKRTPPMSVAPTGDTSQRHTVGRALDSWR
jgi:hypothetical protein